MKISSIDKILNLYEKSADSYSKMMDTEINLPIYSDTLSRLAIRISETEGSILDTSCGSGHMLHMYHQRFDPSRQLVGVDLSPRMVAIASEKLGTHATTFVSDMRNLSKIPSNSSAAVINFFAIHHINPEDAILAFEEWYRVLHTSGQLVVGAWEGSGLIDYGEESDVLAQKYLKSDITKIASKSGFSVDRCVVELVEEMEMNAIYLESTKKSMPKNGM